VHLIQAQESMARARIYGGGGWRCEHKDGWHPQPALDRIILGRDLYWSGILQFAASDSRQTARDGATDCGAADKPSLQNWGNSSVIQSWGSRSLECRCRLFPISRARDRRSA